MVTKYRLKFVYSFLIMGIFLIATFAHASFISEIFKFQLLSASDDNKDLLLNMLEKNPEQEDDLDLLSFSPKTTSIDIIPVEMHQGEKGWFSAVLTNKSNGDRIEDASVSFFVSKSNSSPIEWDLLGSAITDTQGIATVKTDIHLLPGSYALKAEFYGDARFMGTSKETYDQNGLTILPKPSPQVIAYVPNRSFFYGFSRPIPIKIEKESLNWQDSDRISIDVIGQGNCYSQCDFIINSEGIIDLEIPSHLKPGDYTINVWHHKENDNYRSSRVIGRGLLSIQILLTTVNVFPATGAYSDDVNIQANLKSVSGDPISEAPLIFSLMTPDGVLEYLGTAITNENGLATLTTPLWMHPGIHNITVEFEGSDSYAANQDQNTLIVFKENTQIYLPLAETISEDYFDIVAYLYDNDYSPLRDLELIFYYRDHELGDVDPWHLIGTNKTGIDGKATYLMQKDAVPLLTDILVLFKENLQYKSAISTSKLEYAIEHISFSEIEIDPIYYGHVAEIEGSLISNGSVEGITIYCRIWNETMEEVTSTVTDGNGTFILITEPIVFAPRIYPLELRYEVPVIGNLTILKTLNVLPQPISLEVFLNDQEFTDNEELFQATVEDTVKIEIAVSLVDDDPRYSEQPVEGVILSLQIRNSTNEIVLETLTQSNELGSVIESWIPKNEGQHSLSVSINDSRYVVDLFETIYINIATKTARIELELVDLNSTGYYRRGQEVEVLITALQSSYDNPPSSLVGLVELWAEDIFLSTILFNGSSSTHVHKFNISLNVYEIGNNSHYIPAGTYNLTAKLVGRNPTIGSVEVSPCSLIIKDRTRLKLKTAFNIVSQTIQIRVSLIDQESYPISNAIIYIILDEILNASTDEWGVATFDLSESLAQTIISTSMTLFAFYEGDICYEPTLGVSEDITDSVKAFLRSSPSLTEAYVTNSMQTSLNITEPEKLEVAVDTVKTLLVSNEPALDVERWNNFFEAIDAYPYFSAEGVGTDVRFTFNPPNEADRRGSTPNAFLTGFEWVTIGDPLVTLISREYSTLKTEFQETYGNIFDIDFPTVYSNITTCALDEGFDFTQERIDSPIDVGGYIYVTLTPREDLAFFEGWNGYTEDEFPLTIAVPSPISSDGFLTGFPCPLPHDGIGPAGTSCEVCNDDNHVTFAEFKAWIDLAQDYSLKTWTDDLDPNTILFPVPIYEEGIDILSTLDGEITDLNNTETLEEALEGIEVPDSVRWLAEGLMELDNLTDGFFSDIGQDLIDKVENIIDMFKNADWSDWPDSWEEVWQSVVAGMSLAADILNPLSSIVKKALMKLVLTKGLELLVIVLDAIGVDILDLLGDIFSKTYNVIKDFKDALMPDFIGSIGTIMKDGLNQIANGLASLAPDSTTFDDLPSFDIPTIPIFSSTKTNEETFASILPTDQIFSGFGSHLGLLDDILTNLFGLNETDIQNFEQLFGKISIPVEKLLGILMEVFSLLIKFDFSGIKDLFQRVSSAAINWTVDNLRMLMTIVGNLIEKILNTFVNTILFDIPLRLLGGVIDLLLIPVYIFKEVGEFLSPLGKRGSSQNSRSPQASTSGIHSDIDTWWKGLSLRLVRLGCKAYQHLLPGDSLWGHIGKLIVMVTEDVLAWAFFISDNYKDIGDMSLNAFFEEALLTIFAYPWRPGLVNQTWIDEGLAYKLQELFWLDWIPTLGQLVTLIAYPITYWSLEAPPGTNKSMYFSNINFFKITDEKGNEYWKRYNAEWPNQWFSTLLTPYFAVLLGKEIWQYLYSIGELIFDFSWKDFTDVIANLFDIIINIIQALLEFLTPLIEGVDGEDITTKTIKYLFLSFLPVPYKIQHFYGDDGKEWKNGWWKCSSKEYNPGREQDNGKPTCSYEKWNKGFQYGELGLLALGAAFNCEAGVSEIALTIFELAD